MTKRREIIKLLQSGQWSARGLSQAVHLSEKEVYEHLEHIRKTLHAAFKIRPARCLACGFVFTKRDAVRPPSRCPLCRSEHIEDPLFSAIVTQQTRAE